MFSDQQDYQQLAMQAMAASASAQAGQKNAAQGGDEGRSLHFGEDFGSPSGSPVIFSDRAPPQSAGTLTATGMRPPPTTNFRGPQHLPASIQDRVLPHPVAGDLAVARAAAASPTSTARASAVHAAAAAQRESSYTAARQPDRPSRDSRRSSQTRRSERVYARRSAVLPGRKSALDLWGGGPAGGQDNELDDDGMEHLDWDVDRQKPWHRRRRTWRMLVPLMFAVFFALGGALYLMSVCIPLARVC